MAISKKIKELKGQVNDDSVKAQYTVPYGVKNASRYKHIDELLVESNGQERLIKKTLGPIDLGIFPFNGTNLYTVSAAEENRIDIIAYKIYGSASLYWVLCYMNNIPDPLNVPAGTILYVPDINSIQQFPNPLS
jgi:hypothetical protein